MLDNYFQIKEEPQKKVSPTPVRFTAMARTSCNPKKTYVIIGGLGGFGLELCQWLVDRGAKSIVLTSRSGIKTGYQQLCIDRWVQEGVNIVVSKLDATKIDEAKQLLELSAQQSPIGGIFNLALVSQKCLFNSVFLIYFYLCITFMHVIYYLYLYLLIHFTLFKIDFSRY